MSNKSNLENLTLFDDNSDNVNTRFSVNHDNSYSKLDIVKSEFLEVQTMTWEELFDGFDKLYAITYSSSVDFICKLLKKFETAEIIFGCEEVMSYSISEIAAFQLRTLEKIKEKLSANKTDLISRIENNTLKMFAARNFLSHEKIYLLEANDGRKRVIMGSANMSNSAFSGRQRENISYFDGEKAFDWYFGVFESLRENSTNDIAAKSLAIADGLGNTDLENIEEVPIFKSVNMNRGMIIEQQIDPSVNERIKFALDVKNLEGKFKTYMPKADKNGLLKISPESVKQTRKRLIDADKQEQELRRVYPQLVIDCALKSVSLNGSSVPLNPDKEEISRDVDLFMEYMNGFEKFHGDTQSAQARYFEFANWFFASPFMAVLRDMAEKYNHNSLPYPVFGLLYGQSKAGKTTFLETLLKMMIGHKVKMPASEFKKSRMEYLRREVKGAPIVVDDMEKDRFREHAVEIIKGGDFGVAENSVNYPAIAISANAELVVAPEIVRRTVVCRVQIGQKNTELMKNSIARRVQKNIGTAFYREYMRRMLDEIPNMLEELKSDDNTESTADILAVSSKIICDIIKEYYGNKLPEYIRELTLDDYFSEKVTGAGVIKKINDMWNTNRKAFHIDKKFGLLRYNAGQTWESDRLIKELPEDLEASNTREWVIMNLDKACDFFGINFKIKKGLWFGR